MAALTFLAACQSRQVDEGNIKHVVICWLKDNSEQSKQEFINAVHSLSSIPQIVNVLVGEIAKSVEPVADNSFDVAFIIDFKSKEDLDAYLVHPHHVSVVKKFLKPALKKVVVYDYKNSKEIK